MSRMGLNSKEGENFMQHEARLNCLDSFRIKALKSIIEAHN